MARSGPWSALQAAARPPCCASSRVSTGTSKAACNCRTTAGLAWGFRSPRLLPWRTLEQNVRLAAPEVTDATLDALFGALGLASHRHHYPGELSLGLARRVALARPFGGA